jgi:signal recognition particle receptor subunit beta
MVFFNYATMQMAAKIVYYGPGLCGKTTNLHHIYAKTSPQSRGEMVSLETETDRTLFFDLLPIDVGVIGGFKTRLQLYTIPGQVFYNTTRKLVLKGVDGIVFVADSQVAMLEANVESLSNLRENLAEIGLSLDDIPLVLQLNKRDLPSIATPQEMLAILDPERRYEYVEAVAASGTGVFETLKMISKLTLRQLRRRMTGEEPAKPAPRPAFRVKEELPPNASRSVPGSGPSTSAVGTSASVVRPNFGGQPAAAASAASPAASQSETATTVMERPEEVEVLEASEEITTTPPADVFPMATEAGAAPEPEQPSLESLIAPPPPEPVKAPEPEIDFSQEKAAKPAEVKHVKVRSSVDVMAELEALRKRATQGTPKAPKKETSALDALLHPPKPKRDLHESITMVVPAGVVPKSKSLRVEVSFLGDNGVVETSEQTIDLGDTSDVNTIAVSLRIEH